MKKFNMIVHMAIGMSIVLLLAYSLNFWGWPFSEDPGEWGAFGDFMGGLLNPLLTFATLLIVLQSLRHTQEELEATRREPHIESNIQLISAYSETIAKHIGRLSSVLGTSEGIYGIKLPSAVDVSDFSDNTAGWTARKLQRVMVSMHRRMQHLATLSPGHPHLESYSNQNYWAFKLMNDKGWLADYPEIIEFIVKNSDERIV